MTPQPRTRKVAIATAVATSLAAACGQGSGDTDAPSGEAGSVIAERVERVEPPSDAPVPETVRGMEDLGYQVARTGGDPSDNLVLSPMSIAYAFAMARAGARGETADELDAVFGFPGEGVHPAFNALTADLVSTDGPPPVAEDDAERDVDEGPEPPTVAIANGLFPDEGITVRDAFLATLAEHYGAGVHPVDFASPQAIETLDAWVQEQTADRIDTLFDELNPATKVVLANAVYLKADWEDAFDPVGDDSQTFTTAENETVDAPMVRRDSAELPHAVTADWEAVELPYAGGELAMRVLIPTDGTDPVELLEPGRMAEIDDQLETGTVEVTIPEWDFASDLDLASVLTDLGLTTPFGPHADFSGMLDGGVQLDQAIHRANISVDRWGTEAAAVTGIEGVVSEPVAPETAISADRPFAFAIVDRNADVPLFVGQVADPTASGTG